MIKLKTCPFCGGEAKLITSITVGTCAKPIARVYCTDCKTSLPWFSDNNNDGMFIEEAVNAWNKRANQTDEYEVNE